MLRPPNTQKSIYTFEWKMEPSPIGCVVTLRWKNGQNEVSSSRLFSCLNTTLVFKSENGNLHIKEAKPEYSSCYTLAMTSENGQVFFIYFKVSVFDHVEKPHLRIERKAMNEGKCQAVLSCLVSRNGNVNYAWYKDSKLIPTWGNPPRLEVQIDANELNTYTCNVSNPASWAADSLKLTQDCLESRFWPLWVVIVILVTLFLGALTCFCVWKRKRKRKLSQSGPSEHLTVYEDVQEIRRNHNSVSTSQPSQETDLTLYSVIQASQKTRCKKKNQDPPHSCTIYDEVGSGASNPARLSRRELENFGIYS